MIAGLFAAGNGKRKVFEVVLGTAPKVLSTALAPTTWTPKERVETAHCPDPCPVWRSRTVDR